MNATDARSPGSSGPTTSAARRPGAAALRAAIERVPGGRAAAAGRASLGADSIDAALPGSGLRLAAVHEVAGHGAAGFTAALAGRVALARPGLVVWCQHRRRRGDEGALYGPGLGAFGLDARRLLLVDGDGDGEVLWATEEALRSPAVAVVVAEVDRIDLFRTRRLQLAAESGGAAGLLLRPCAPAVEPSAAVTRWHVRPLTLPLAGPLAGPLTGPLAGSDDLPPPAWRADLWRAKGAVPASFEVIFDEPTLRFALVADLARGPLPLAGAACG